MPMFNPDYQEKAEAKRIIDMAKSVLVFDDVMEPFTGGLAITAQQALELFGAGDHEMKARDGEVYLFKLNGRMPLHFQIITDL